MPDVVIRECRHCESTFEARSHGPGKQKKYCSENCRKRAYEQAKRGTCVDCGATTGPGSARKGVERCASCYAALQAHQAWTNRRTIELMWADGYLIREIAEELGWSSDHVGVEIFRMRELGWDLPFRYGVARRQASKDGRLVHA